MDYLLRLDFATEPVARESSTKWINKAASLAGCSKWGNLVTGRREITKPTTRSDQRPVRSNSINRLTSVRKKRKVDTAEGDDAAAQSLKSEANILATNLVRKKPKM